ncbi:phytoene desaturase [candidate division KSB1 bacterium]|nr:phytoene desaturase [candidate division KSB1 bacterium]RQW06936.1 MAG: phytoene desaturase [candidate division KSB1 bacterium]
MKKLVVIGAGFGGLSVAIRLQAAGYAVTVLEKNRHVGGHAYPLEKNGYKFDMGPSLITAPPVIEEIFNAAGKKLSDYIELIPLDPYYRIYFHDQTYIDYSPDSDAMKEQMAAFNERDADKYDKFIAASKKIHDAVMVEKLGAQPFMNWSTMLSFAPRALRLGALKTSYQFASGFFKDFRHRFIFSFHPLFIGGNPFKSPAVYQMIPYLEKEQGVWFTHGGMTTLVQAFRRLFEDIGGQVITEAQVSKIAIKDGKAVGVHVGDSFYPADAVVSNADFIHTCKDLLPAAVRKKWSDRRLNKISYGMSAFLLYLGVRKQFPQLKHHTLILSERYRPLIEDIFTKKILPDDFSMYLHVPTRTDAGMAPAGGESMYVLVPVANLQSGIDWQQQGELFKNRILSFLEKQFGLDGLLENLEVCEMFTPDDFRQKNNNYYGSAWGVEPKLTQTAIFRPHNRNEDVPNLYLVGASTHPGAGLPGVMMTAETTAGVIQGDMPV